MGGQFRENYKRLRGIPQKYNDAVDLLVDTIESLKDNEEETE